MSTEFKSALALCGFSRKEAAAFLDVSESSVDKWSRGVSDPPNGVWRDLSARWASLGIPRRSDPHSLALDRLRRNMRVHNRGQI